MNKFFKIAGVAAVLSAGFAAQSALADTVLPSTGNGELVLFVTYNSGGTQFTYARGTGASINDVVSGDTSSIANNNYATGTALAFSFSGLVHDTNLSTFLSNAASASANVTYALMAGDTSNTGNALGQTRYLSTTTANLSTTVAATNGNLATKWNALNGMQNTANAFIGTGVGLDKASTLSNGQYKQTGANATANVWFISPSLNNEVAIGSTANFYMLTTSGGTATAKARAFTLGTFVLNASTGDLSFTAAVAGTAVPVPAAAWLLGSGLLGLAGVGRRKRAV